MWHNLISRSHQEVINTTVNHAIINVQHAQEQHQPVILVYFQLKLELEEMLLRIVSVSQISTTRILTKIVCLVIIGVIHVPKIQPAWPVLESHKSEDLQPPPANVIFQALTLKFPQGPGQTISTANLANTVNIESIIKIEYKINILLYLCATCRNTFDNCESCNRADQIKPNRLDIPSCECNIA